VSKKPTEPTPEPFTKLRGTLSTAFSLPDSFDASGRLNPGVLIRLETEDGVFQVITSGDYKGYQTELATAKARLEKEIAEFNSRITRLDSNTAALFDENAARNFRVEVGGLKRAIEKDEEQLREIVRSDEYRSHRKTHLEDEIAQFKLEMDHLTDPSFLRDLEAARIDIARVKDAIGKREAEIREINKNAPPERKETLFKGTPASGPWWEAGKKYEVLGEYPAKWHPPMRLDGVKGIIDARVIELLNENRVPN